ncbi:MAG: SDR family oxidoreductase [Candidatus Eremiobacteraeota bacterium]|nr:SDR family oxidoreductase [Candidatus Eremiobacteraeota bacterium]
MTITDVFARDLFAGKTVFVTGGGSGINLGIAKTFATLGASLAICGRSQERLDAAAAELRELGGNVFSQSADVRDYGALEAAMRGAHEALGPIAVLVAGAAGNFPASAEAITPNGFKAVVDIDLLGSFNAARAAFDDLKATRGSIVFISAGQAFTPYPYQAHVGAAKAGVDMLMRDLAVDWGKFGIRSNSVAPGPIDGTEGMRRLAPGEGTKERLAAAVPLRRLGSVNDIGNVAAFLASPLASYVTGCVLVADGGQNLLGSGLWASIGLGQS